MSRYPFVSRTHWTSTRSGVSASSSTTCSNLCAAAHLRSFSKWRAQEHLLGRDRAGRKQCPEPPLGLGASKRRIHPQSDDKLLAERIIIAHEGEAVEAPSPHYHVEASVRAGREDVDRIGDWPACRRVQCGRFHAIVASLVAEAGASCRMDHPMWECWPKTACAGCGRGRPGKAREEQSGWGKGSVRELRSLRLRSKMAREQLQFEGPNMSTLARRHKGDVADRISGRNESVTPFNSYLPTHQPNL